MKNLWQSFSILLILSIILGIFYPGFITLVAQTFFKDRSEILVAQRFTHEKYFWPRPSPASNLSPTSIVLQNNIQERTKMLATKHGVDDKSVPKELVTTSASGLDPHISTKAAFFQLDRVAKARHFDEQKIEQLRKLIDDLSEGPNILINLLNLKLDDMAKE